MKVKNNKRNYILNLPSGYSNIKLHISVTPGHPSGLDMAGKRAASRMMAQVASMAKKSKQDLADEDPFEKEESEEEYRARAAEFFKNESPENYFRSELCKYSAAERYYEYLYFLRNLPDLLDPEKSELVNLVKRELQLEGYTPSEKDTTLLNRQSSFADSSTPVLDALSCKIGNSLTMWLFPPTKNMPSM